MSEQKKMMHLAIRNGEVGGYVLMPGSPERAEALSAYLDDAVDVAYNREFHTFTGYLDGTRVSITSSGMGGPSVAIAVEELRECGAHTIIRVGTCGSMQPVVQVGQIVLPNGAVRMEGVAQQYAPIEYPAVPDMKILTALEEAASLERIPFKIGVNVTKACFSTQYLAAQRPNPVIAQRWEGYRRGGALCADMGCAPFFVAASSLGVRAGAVLGVAFNDNEYNDDFTAWPVVCEELACRTAIAALRILIREEKKND